MRATINSCAIFVMKAATRKTAEGTNNKMELQETCFEDEW
jgi:hypothetical protein